jgi:hypothetical protein
MKKSHLCFCIPAALVHAGAIAPGALAQQDARPDSVPTQGQDGGNKRWDYLYGAPSTGANSIDWDAVYWSRFCGYAVNIGNPYPPARYPTEGRNEPLYAVFWDIQAFSNAPGSFNFSITRDTNNLILNSTAGVVTAAGLRAVPPAPSPWCECAKTGEAAV